MAPSPEKTDLHLLCRRNFLCTVVSGIESSREETHWNPKEDPKDPKCMQSKTTFALFEVILLKPIYRNSFEMHKE